MDEKISNELNKYFRLNPILVEKLNVSNPLNIMNEEHPRHRRRGYATHIIDNLIDKNIAERWY